MGPGIKHTARADHHPDGNIIHIAVPGTNVFLSVSPGSLHQVIFPPKRGSEGALPDPGIQFPEGVVLKLRWSSFVGDRINVSVPLTPDFQVSESPFYKSEKMQPISKLEEFTCT